MISQLYAKYQLGATHTADTIDGKVDKPTRGDNILDLILTSNEALVDNVNMDEHFVSSDHCVVKFDITCNISRKYWKLFYYDYRHGKYEAMKTYLA